MGDKQSQMMARLSWRQDSRPSLCVLKGWHSKASWHRSPRGANSHRHREVARCWGWRWNYIRGCVSRRDSQGNQRSCGTRGQLTNDHQGSAKSFSYGSQQGKGNCCQYKRRQQEGDFKQVGWNGYEQQADQEEYWVLHQEYATSFAKMSTAC